MCKFYSSGAALKILTISFCFAFVFIYSADAQIPVFTSSNLALRTGDKFVYVGCDTIRFDTTQTGENQVWDYTYLTDITIADTETCVLPSATPYSDSFPGATSAIIHNTIFGPGSRYDYSSDDSGYFTEGYYQTNPVSYSISQKPFALSPLYPFTYGTVYIDSNSTVTVADIDPARHVFTGADTIVADGYGTLLLPGATIHNVVRVRTSTSYVTTTSNLFGSLTVTVQAKNHYFLTPGYHAGVLRLEDVTTITSGSFFGIPVLPTVAESKDIIRATNIAEVLPLQIVSFAASLSGKNVLLQWQTANEMNTHSFAIQRSANGVQFATINTMAATGAGGDRNTYSYTDAGTANLQASQLYYRLVETDNDGKTAYSAVRTVALTNLHSLFTVSPNPAKNYINIVSSGNVQNALVKVTDAGGKTLFTAKQNFVAGQPLRVSLSQFAGGILLVTVVNKEHAERFTIVKE